MPQQFRLLFAALTVLALAVSSASAQQYDLLIKGGHVIDAANNIDAVRDVAVKGGLIARVAENIPADQAKKTIDVRGRYVTPGLIDLHAHVFGYSGSILPDDTALLTGVTTVADCGGAGWRTFDEFKETVIDRVKTRVYSFINIVGHGMVGSRYESDDSDMDPVKTSDKIKQYPDLIVGIKVAHYAKPGWNVIDQAIKAGNLANRPIIVDNSILSNTGRDTRTKLLEKFRPGDIHTHSYNDRHVEIVNRLTGEIQPWMWEARKRGVLFDLGHGNGSFVWPNAVAAMKGGFPPDTISTDLHQASMLSSKSDMPNCISKMMLLGMPLKEAIYRSTQRPAEVIKKYPEIGTLSEGKAADIAVFELESGVFAFADAWRKKMMGNHRLQAVMTVRAGEVVFDRDGLGFPEWQKAGQYDVIE